MLEVQEGKQQIKNNRQPGILYSMRGSFKTNHNKVTAEYSEIERIFSQNELRTRKDERLCVNENKNMSRWKSSRVRGINTIFVQ